MNPVHTDPPQCPWSGKCLEPAVQEKLKRQAVGRGLLKDVRRLDLHYREYQIIEMLLELSYGWGLESVIIPKLDNFVACTGVARPHVSKYIQQLVDIGLVLITKTEDGPRYAVNINRNQWHCRPKVSRESLVQSITEIKMFNRLDSLPPAYNEDATGCPHFFKELCEAQNTNAAVTASVTVTSIKDLP